MLGVFERFVNIKCISFLSESDTGSFSFRSKNEIKCRSKFVCFSLFITLVNLSRVQRYDDVHDEGGQEDVSHPGLRDVEVVCATELEKKVDSEHENHNENDHHLVQVPQK